MCLGRAFHLILMHFYILYSMLWGKLSKIRLIFLKSCFSRIKLIQSDFRSIEILFKKFSEPLPGSIDRTYFSINWRPWIQFFKNSVLTDSTYFFKTFSTFFLSLSPTWQGNTTIFCRFLPKFLQGFPPSRPVRPFYPSFCSYIHAFFHAFKGYFRTFLILGFLLIQGYFSEIDHWVLLVYCYIHDCCWLIWSIWDFMENWKF